MYAPLLGRQYAHALLKVLQKEEEATFTKLKSEIDMSTATLSVTLQDLTTEGYIHRKRVGKYTVYSLTDKGFNEADKKEQGNPVIENLALYIYREMREKGLLEPWPDAEKYEVLKAIKERTQKLIEQVAVSTAEMLRKGRS